MLCDTWTVKRVRFESGTVQCFTHAQNDKAKSFSLVENPRTKSNYGFCYKYTTYSALPRQKDPSDIFWWNWALEVCENHWNSVRIFYKEWLFDMVHTSFLSSGWLKWSHMTCD